MTGRLCSILCKCLCNMHKFPMSLHLHVCVRVWPVPVIKLITTADSIPPLYEINFLYSVNIPLSILFSLSIWMWCIVVNVGLMPYNFLCVEAGCILSEIRSTSDIFTTATMLKMGAAAAATFVPSLIMKYLKRGEEKVAVS